MKTVKRYLKKYLKSRPAHLPKLKFPTNAEECEPIFVHLERTLNALMDDDLSNTRAEEIRLVRVWSCMEKKFNISRDIAF